MASYDYDFIVIGGGSGGMAAAKEAAHLGAKVAMFDYVKPSTQGTTWGIGGTCVNVGCVPKKLMHYASSMAPVLHHDAEEYGWKIHEKIEHDWQKMVQTVQNHVKSLNFGYRGGLRSAKVEYINALGKFSDSHTVQFNLKGEEKCITGRYIAVAVGGRPHVPADIPGARELAITSDDIFSLKKNPGKTLVVGASYIALECAGFLAGLGLPVTVAVRSILLRGFDRQCSEFVGRNMEAEGVKFYRGVTPARLDKEGEKIRVTFTGDRAPEEFDTVLFATGRDPDTPGLNLAAAGLVGEAVTKAGKIVVDVADRADVPGLRGFGQTSVGHIFTLGDAAEGRMELTPVAIKAGEALSRRLFAKPGGDPSVQPPDWDLVATAVFTPSEYGCVGLSEEKAIERFGESDVEVYLFEYTTLELAAAHRTRHPSTIDPETPWDNNAPTTCLAKLVCRKSQDEKVVGLHFVGAHAGEIVQGFAVAMRLGARKADFDGTVGIHPTDVEAFTTLSVTRRSGESWVAAGGCGGGKCG